MGSLTGKKPSATYKSLLHVDGTDNQELSTSLKIIEDGAGNDSALKISLASGGVGISVDNLQISGNSIISTDSGGHVTITPNAAGDVQLSADTIRVGDNNADATITTHGAGDLTLSTNAGSSSGIIEIEDGTGGDIKLTPAGSRSVVMSKVDVAAGEIDGTAIGENAVSTGAFSTVSATGEITAAAGINLSGGILRGSIASLVAGTHNSYSAVGRFIVHLNSAAGNVILTGFTGGVAGQIIYIIKSSSSNTVSLSNDVTSTQRIFTRSGANETVGQSGVKATNPRGGWILICDGTHWYSIGR